MDWKNQINNKMEDYSEAVPDGLWSDISQKTGISEKKKSPVILWSTLAGLSAAAAVIFAVIFHYNTGAETESGYYSQNGKIIENQNGQAENTFDVINPAPENIGELLAYNYVEETHPVMKEKTSSAAEKTADGIGEIYSGTDRSGMEGLPDTENREPVQEEQSAKQTETSIQENIFISPEQEHKKRHFKTSGKRFDISLTTSSFLPSKGSENAYSAIYARSNEISDGVMMMNWNRDVSTDYKYSLPVSAGISLSYNITKTWAIDTGVRWTMLATDIRSGSETNYSREKEILHYIAIPLNVKANIWESRFVSVYAVAGGTMQKMVDGKNIATYYYQNTEASKQTTDLVEKPVQWSVNANAGIQFNCTDFVGIYADPGIVYYFDNHSDIKNIYKDRPLNFNLSLGVRFSF